MGELQKGEKSRSLAKYTFPVVGIGASAGGLDAIKKLLENLPQLTGLAFVIVQHLATGQESMLPEILSRSTKMPVQKIQNEMQIEPDNVYVIPSGTTITINDGVLKLQPKGVSLKPIDTFLLSLASDKKTLAIGIVLSGTGTDGTEGLKLIKAEGGITFAQDPKSALYPDMPNSAIEAETVDFIFPPERIAEELSRIGSHPDIVRHELTTAGSRVESEDSTQTIFALLKATFGVNFANYKQSTTNRRITRRMVISKIGSTKNYVAYLRMHQDELQALFDDLLIAVTSFFREPGTFAFLEEKVFPSFLEKRTKNETIRVWIPGCSTGEEVYSVAIAIEEFFEEKKAVGVPIQIFGSDVNPKNVEKARKGIYPKSIENNVSTDRLKRFFTPIKGNYQVTKQIRDMCIFAKHDITKDPPFSNLNLIVCRNVFIYFDSQLQERVMPTFHHSLKPNGYLVLGEAESVGKFKNLFESMNKKGLVFRKKMAQPSFDLAFEPPTPYSLIKPIEQSKETDLVTLLKDEVDNLLMAQYVPASLVLNGNLDILVFRGKVNPYISVDSGAASLNVAKIVRKELRGALQTGVYRAKKNLKEVKETVRFVQGNQKKVVHIQVKPVKTSKSEELFFLALFEEVAKATPSKDAMAGEKKGEVESAKDQQINELSEDLNSTKQTLQTVIEQQDATNEELRSSMEELQSSNEELMSTNEELETAKEELQSSNEELTTLNNELKNRNQNLSVLNDDLTNLMRNVDSAVVIVDQDFRIRRFNNAAKELLRLMPSDVDIPITSIRLGIPIEDLENLLTKATSLEIIRQEIQNGKGRWYQMRVRPYLTGEKKATGLVISFADVTEIKNLEDKIKVVSSFTRHDVRNKLMAVKGNIYLAKKHVEERPEVEKYLNQIPDEMAKIDRILDVSKSYEMLGSQELTLVDVGRSVDDAASQFGDLKGAKIINDVRGFKLLADQMLSTLFGNLIDNTLKYSAKATRIRIYAKKQTDDSTNLIYEDDGVGISYEDKNRLFEQGYGKGSGLGLFLIKRTCEIYGWTVTENGEPGKGARFVFEIPKNH